MVLQMLNNEAVLLSTLNHPGVFSCNGVFNEEDGLGCYLVCRYCEEGTVVRYLRSHPEADRFLLVRSWPVSLLTKAAYRRHLGEGRCGCPFVPSH